jgi:hypothetical protein
MRKAWKALALAGAATLTAQFGFVGAVHAQTTGPTTGAATTGRGGTVGGTTAGATTGVAPTPIPVQPRFTG